MFVQSVVNLSPSFSEERPERKSERERERALQKCNAFSDSLSIRVLLLSVSDGF